ncbi:MAG TPA: hypothetical protein DDZ89_00135 [Clostridiales bacterium]|nr:hypothetical protein [Clostridiales bacterium]
MKKAFLVYCLVFVFIFSTACKSEKIEQQDPASIDPYMIEHPVDAILEDIYGLDTELTAGKIVYAHKYYDPANETLTYELLYDQSGGEETFVKNTEEHFSIPLTKTSDKNYTGKNEQFENTIHFDDDESVLLTVKIFNVYTSVTFLYMDNEYPDQLTPDYPEKLNVFAAIRGLEYDGEDNTLSFERFWTVNNEFATEFIEHYENIYKDEHEKAIDETTGGQSVVAKANDYVSLIASAKPTNENQSEISFIIRYFLNDAPKGE